jgi:hypothetical protein
VTSTAAFMRSYRKALRALPRAIPRYYWHSGVNDPIGLYRGPLTLVGPHGRVKATGNIRIEWLPEPSVFAEADAILMPGDHSRLDITSRIRVELPSAVPIRRLVSTPPEEKGPALEKSGKAAASSSISIAQPERFEFIGDTKALVTEVRFGVPNFPDVLGQMVGWPDGTGWRLRLVAVDHTVILDARPDYRNIQSELRSRGGYALTHAGLLTFKRKKSIRSVRRYLEALQYFLTFASGRWTGPVLPVGVKGGRPAWTLWQLPQLDPWGTPWTWLDFHDGDALPALYPVFMRLWRSNQWRKTIRIAIASWVVANRPNPLQGAIVFAQLVLELLARTTLVDRKLLSRRAAKNLNADELIRMLLLELGIPSPIPKDLKALRRWSAKTKPALDGPAALTRLRNRVVHGHRQSREPAFGVWVDAWRLASQYVELCILSMLEYRGRYSNRLVSDRWVGQSEPVPWASN